MSYEQFLGLFFEKVPEIKLSIDKKKYFWDPHNNLEWCREHKIDPLFVGRYVGEKKRNFIPSPFGVALAAEHANTGITLDKKGAWLFVCGRDVFSRAIVSGKPHKGKASFVYDEEKNLLGYGVWLTDNLAKQNEVALAHKSDIGRYLRS